MYNTVVSIMTDTAWPIFTPSPQGSRNFSPSIRTRYDTSPICAYCACTTIATDSTLLPHHDGPHVPTTHHPALYVTNDGAVDNIRCTMANQQHVFYGDTLSVKSQNLLCLLRDGRNIGDKLPVTLFNHVFEHMHIGSGLNEEEAQTQQWGRLGLACSCDCMARHVQK